MKKNYQKYLSIILVAATLFFLSPLDDVIFVGLFSYYFLDYDSPVMWVLILASVAVSTYWLGKNFRRKVI